MKPYIHVARAMLLAASLLGFSRGGFAASYAVSGWNDLGIHFLDSDYSVFAIHPPYNTLHAHVIYQGRLLTNTANITLTYQAVADATGSSNRTSQGKNNFWQYAPALFGTNLPPDQGLAGFSMPGTNNTPQGMTYETRYKWFKAEGIPITPKDDAGNKNYYPMMRLVARTNTTVLASADVVVPVSDEHDCRGCHMSGGSAAAQPSAGWVWECDDERDYRLNILRLHDQRAGGQTAYSNALAAAGYHPAGLYATVISNTTPVLCVRCHQSNLLPRTGQAGVRPLTQVIHSRHAGVVDPATGLTLEAMTTQAACYNCHPGTATKSMRGAMSHAANASGQTLMSCQNCHGAVSQMGQTNRVGWYDEPDCQSCHTGTATSNNGQIRYATAFEPSGQVRVAVNQTFATDPNTPTNGFSLFRFSTGHGGLACSACHGSPHAEYISSQPNDNVLSQQLQGHQGIVAECTACHTANPSTVTGGPHGLHPIGSTWVSGHRSPGGNPTQCQACHGANYRGTILSQMQATRSLNAVSGTKTFVRGAQIGCYDCHNGPTDFNGNANAWPVAVNTNKNTGVDIPVTFALSATDANGNALTYRIATYPTNGLVYLTNSTATYHPKPGYAGSDSFTFFASDNSADCSPAGVVSLTVTQGVCVLTATTTVPNSAQAGQNVPFRAAAALSRCAANPTYQWSFGDGSPASTEPNPCHVYAAEGSYPWTLVATANGVRQTNQGVITITAAPAQQVYLTISSAPGSVVISWPTSATGYQLEATSVLGSPSLWNNVTDPVTVVSNQNTVTIQNPVGNRFYRLKK